MHQLEGDVRNARLHPAYLTVTHISTIALHKHASPDTYVLLEVIISDTGLSSEALLAKMELSPAAAVVTTRGRKVRCTGR